jgi:hypothetical protein
MFRKIPKFEIWKKPFRGARVETTRQIEVTDLKNAFLKLFIAEDTKIVTMKEVSLNISLTLTFLYLKHFSILFYNIALKFSTNLFHSQLSLNRVTYDTVQVVHLIFFVRSHLAIRQFCTEGCCINKPSFGIWLLHCVHQYHGTTPLDHQVAAGTFVCLLEK